MYHSVLNASKEKGKQPGTTINNPKELRIEMINKINELGPSTTGPCQGWWTLFSGQPDIKTRIQEGIDNPGSSLAWGGGAEINLIECMYDIRIKVISENGVQFGRNFQAADNVIVLYYKGGIHYDWLEEVQYIQYEGKSTDLTNFTIE